MSHHIIRLRNKYLLINIIGFLLFTILHIHISQDHLITHIHRIFLHQVLNLPKSAFVIFHLQINTEFLHRELFILPHYLFQTIQRPNHFTIIFLLIIQIKQSKQRFSFSRETGSHRLKQSYRFLLLILLLIKASKGLAIPIIIRCTFHRILQSSLALRHLLQKHIILRNLIKSRSCLRVNGQTVFQQVECSIILLFPLQPRCFKEEVIILTLLLVRKGN